ncbi:MAG: hypothetical protein AUJ52_06455 [Elusimicrobia bacterium CG1_02_63_36]|nr:MAG: hypothetical protein AUJ52_06455 [Elusimicrobia bacterium CG1_02_63_36]PIP82979.1 MAG: hypothetical protein COR54_11760 [Elusimicrobia bacterium CG22_combo_CG10-13_8_21_14_all_63_91]PJA17473.1 MAG: hypothetical protein COX66_04290 [Elusimicrobia bacterium CG_4_10_14_0_2_um_filter_63_34]PJB25455.1 MAG: hypothetical protein CO113_08670 [Elusimicrobia bacterium CG_4_9_14_3_um_filter_62_55]
MIPLGTVEEKLHKALGVLQTGFEGSPEDLLARVEGLPRVWTPRSSMFFEIDAFPVLGTGKSDLKALQSLADELGGDPPD